MAYTRVFIHGLESSGSGTKGSFFSRRYRGMLTEDFKGSLEQRMARLEKLLADKKDLILVGSSYGGLMAALYTCDHPDKVKKLVLLAPALDLPDFDRCLSNKIDVPAELFHGRGDDVVDPAPVKEKAVKVFGNLTYHLVEDDHPLTATFPLMDWDRLLENR
ncbi:MAG: alpha/beta fold hydrolase [Syntrophaceae bacterium]